jgi:dephospho-CoA kinase
MLKVGLTGNIGSGKTFVSKIFESMGIPVYNSDLQAKRLMTEDMHIKDQIIKLLGSDSYHNDVLQTHVIAEKVFNNDALLTSLNNIVHPAVHKSLATWFKQHQGNTPYALQEAALIIESGGYLKLDKIILVTAPESLRLKRLEVRDKQSIAAIKKRMAKQMTEEEKIPYADFIISNDGKSMLLPQVHKIHAYLSHFFTQTTDN